MALIRCEECGREISSKAAACPGCGCPVTGRDYPAPSSKSLRVLEKAQRKRDRAAAPLKAKSFALGLAGYSKKPRIVCPYCQEIGHVLLKRTRQKRGISGGKTVGMLFSGGLSLLFVGLSRTQRVTLARCTNCGADWQPTGS